MKVSFPIFSNLNDNEERLRRGYLYMLKLLTISISPVLIGMAVIAPTGEVPITIRGQAERLCAAHSNVSSLRLHPFHEQFQQ